MARPSRLTKTLVDGLCAEVERGLPITLATAAAGLGRRSVYDWLAEARLAEEAGTPAGWGEGESAAREFSHRLAGARAKLAGRLADSLLAGEQDHRALAYLERTRLPEYYGDRALEASVAALEPPAAASDEGAGQTGATATVPVALVRCGACGEEQLEGKRLCGDCGALMAPATGAA